MKRTGLIVAAIGLFIFVQSARAQWTPVKRLTWNSGHSVGPAIAVDPSGHYHLVWSDDTPGDSEIYYKKSTDGGSTWSANKRLTWTSTGSHHPRFGVDSLGHLHVVYHDYTASGYSELFYKKSTNGGDTWSVGQRLTWNSGSSESPVIGLDSLDRLHVFWEDDTPGYPNHDIYYKKSANGGVSWSTSQRLTRSAGRSIDLALAIDSSGHLHLFWGDDTLGFAEIYYKKSTNGGDTWSAGQRITWTSGDSQWPGIAIDVSGRLHLVWEEDLTTSYEVHYKKSTDGGASWTMGKKITETSGSAYKPVIAADPAGNVHVVWSDDTPGHPDIYYRKTTNGGATWATALRLCWTAGNSFRPAVAVDASGYLLVAWDDFTPGNGEIYFRKGK